MADEVVTANRCRADTHGMAGPASLRRTIILAVIGALLATAVVWVSMIIVSVEECLSENTDRPFAWPWSPRREFCGGGSDDYTIVMLLLPSVLVAAGAFLWRRGRHRLAGVVFVLLVPLPFITPIYVNSLDYYLLDEYPILHAPLLRLATDTQPPRVCYAYGIVLGPNETPINDKTERVCIDLLPNDEALASTPEYDEGHTGVHARMGRKEADRVRPPARDRHGRLPRYCRHPHVHTAGDRGRAGLDSHRREVVARVDLFDFTRVGCTCSGL